ncbi:MAG TPA: hypothetical protein VGS27_27965 [Candidatus Sulfotelmatobacter sp.]|nr:hypothetical protein [Candidatus Sulfotelmatobacter sp.]
MQSTESVVTGRILRILLAAALMLIAANCFLRYLWWTACYSAWYGIPKLADQWRAAGTRASLNGWGVILLELAGIAVLFTAIRSRPSSGNGPLTNAARLIFSTLITVVATAIFALLLSWVKQGMQ